MNVTVVMTGDEESSGDPQWRARRCRRGQRGRVAIGFEDGDGDPSLR